MIVEIGSHVLANHVRFAVVHKILEVISDELFHLLQVKVVGMVSPLLCLTESDALRESGGSPRADENRLRDIPIPLQLIGDEGGDVGTCSYKHSGPPRRRLWSR